MPNLDDDHDQDGTLEPAKNSPAADPITPQAVIRSSERLAEEFGILSTKNPRGEKMLNLRGGRLADVAKILSRLRGNSIPPAHARPLPV